MGCVRAEGVSTSLSKYLSTLIHAESFFASPVVVKDGLEEVFGGAGRTSEILGEVTLFAIAKACS
jgi:hypothetical protein